MGFTTGSRMNEHNWN